MSFRIPVNRIDQRGETINNIAFDHLDGTDFRNAMGTGAAARGLDIDNAVRLVRIVLPLDPNYRRRQAGFA